MSNVVRVFKHILITIFLGASVSKAVPENITMQTKILKPNGQVLEAASVNFRYTTLDPLGTCVLFVENFTNVDMTSSGGLSVHNLGTGTSSFSAGTASYSSIYNNSQTYTCQSGGTYIPGTTDRRKVVIQFNDNSGAGWQTLQAIDINSVPFSLYAGDSTKLNGHTGSEYVLASSFTDCATSGKVLTYNGTSFTCVAAGGGGSGTVTNVTSANSYISIATGTTTPVITANVGTAANTLAAGNDSRITGAAQKSANLSDLASAATARTNLGLGTAAVTNTGTASGNVPVLDGTGKLASSVLPSSAVTTTTTLAGDVTGTIAATVVSNVGAKTAAEVAQSVTDTQAATTANTASTIVKRDGSGNVSVSGVSATNISTQNNYLYDGTNTNRVILKAPAAGITNYTMTLPPTIGTANQILGYNNAGTVLENKSITAGSGVSVTHSAGGIQISATGAASQWTTTGSDIYYTTGNVGIGTTVPTSALDIYSSGVGSEGDLTMNVEIGNAAPYSTPPKTGIGFKGKIDGTATTVYYSGVTGGKENTTSGNTAGYFTVSTRPNGGLPIERMRITSTGNVGIGTTTPGAKLEVAGQVKITGGTPGAGKVLTSDAAGLASWTTPSGTTQWTTTGSDIYYAGGNVNVGGTSTPTSNLTVTGNQNITGNLAVGTGAAPNYGLEVKRNTIFFTDTAGTTPYLYADGTNMTFGGSSSSLSKVGVVGNAAIGSGYANTTAAPTNGLIVEGNVGIGTNNPGAKLEVGGQIKITGGTPGAGKVLTSDATGLASWSTATSGTVTNVTSANSYLSIATGTTTPVITANVGTGANTLAAGDDSRITGAVQQTAYNGDIANVLDSNCGTGSTPKWNVVADAWTCVAIGSLPASAITSGTIATARLGSGTADATTFLRGDGTWANPSSETAVVYKVRVASSSDITLAGTQTVDDIALSVGDRVLAMAQTNQLQNGVYVVSAGTWTRAADLSTTAQASNYTVLVTEGTNFATMQFKAFPIPGYVMDTMGLHWVAMGAAYSTSYGFKTLVKNTTGAANSGFGYLSLSSNTTGSLNSAFGDNSLVLNTTGEYNTAVGSYASGVSTTGSRNTAVGVQSLYRLTTGNDNVAIGSNASSGSNVLYALGTGSNNVFIGADTGSTGANGANADKVTLIGDSARTTFTSSQTGVQTYATAIGAGANVRTTNTVVLGRTTDTTVIGNHTRGSSPALLQVTGSGYFSNAVAVGTAATPTGKVHITAGTAAAGTAPIKLTAGTNLTTPEAGAIEFDGTNLYYTDSTPTRRTIATTGSVGTVTSVTSANTDISVATTTSTPVLTLNSGTGANQIVKLDGSAKLPAVDGSALTNLTAANLASAVPINKGGTNATTAAAALTNLLPTQTGNAGKFLVTDGTSASWGDAISQTAYNGDIANVLDSNCGTGSTPKWNVVADAWTCVAIGSLPASAITSGTIATARLGSGTADSTTFLRGDNTWATVSGVPASGGTAGAPGYAFSGDLNTGLFSAGADTLGLATNGTSKLAIDSSGNVTINPGNLLVTNGGVLAASDSFVGGSRTTSNSIFGVDTGGWVTFWNGQNISAPYERVKFSPASIGNSSGTMVGLKINLPDSTTGTGGYSGIVVDKTGAGTGSGAKNLLDLQVGGTSQFLVNTTGDAVLSKGAVQFRNLASTAYITNSAVDGRDLLSSGYPSNSVNVVGTRADGKFVSVSFDPSIGVKGFYDLPNYTSFFGFSYDIDDPIGNTPTGMYLSTDYTTELWSGGYPSAVFEYNYTDFQGIGDNNASDYPMLLLSRSRGAVGAKTTVAAGDILGSLEFRGYPGATNGWDPTGSQIQAIATTGAMTLTSIPSRLAFSTTVSGGSLTEKMTILGDGKVGIGTPTPGTTLDVTGTARVSGQVSAGSQTISGGTTAINWDNGNAISTDYDCASAFAFANLRDGGTYTLVVRGTGTTQCTFSTTTTGTNAATVSYRFNPANAVRTASSHTIYTLMRVGTVVYVSWSTGF